MAGRFLKMIGYPLAALGLLALPRMSSAAWHDCGNGPVCPDCSCAPDGVRGCFERCIGTVCYYITCDCTPCS